MTTATIRIGERLVGPAYPALIIAEVGVNHDGDLAVAKRLITASKAAGADAVKFQTFAAARLTTRQSPKAPYQLQATDVGETQYDMLERLELSTAAHRSLMEYASECGLVFLSTPFDQESSDLLEALDVPAFKIGSGELTDLPFLRHVARKRRPMILSTGMSTRSEVEEGVRAIQAEGVKELALLHCVSAYPAPVQDVNLRVIHVLQETFNVPIGYSDHTEGVYVPALAVAAGACIIEKHITLDRHRVGPDHATSLEPDQFAAMVRGIRNAEAVLGNGDKRVMPSELNIRAVARKSVVALVDIPRDCILAPEMIGIRRPGPEGSVQPAELDSVLSRRVDRDVPRGSPLYRDWIV